MATFLFLRLVCTLLGSCGQYFSKGSVGRRLDAFLVAFQRYVLAKPPLPLHVEFDVQVRTHTAVSRSAGYSRPWRLHVVVISC